MPTKKFLPLQAYLEKLQEAADEVASEKNLRKIRVFHLHGGNFACSRTGNQMGLSILDEARARVNAKYELKTEE